MWFFRDIGNALFRWNRYDNLKKNTMGRAIGTGLIFAVCIFVITLLPLVYAYKVELGGFDGILQKIPDFRIQNGKLWVAESIEDVEEDAYVRIDTAVDLPNVGSTELQEVLQEYTNVLLVDADAVISKTSGNFQTIYFADLMEDVQKSDLYELKGIYYAILGLVIGLTLGIYILIYFIGNLLVALFALPFAGIRKVRFGDVYKLAFYARSWSIVLGLVNMVLTIPYISGIRFVLSIGILIYAIRRMDKPEDTKRMHNIQGEDIFASASRGEEKLADVTGQEEEIKEQRKNYGDIKPSDTWSFGNNKD